MTIPIEDTSHDEVQTRPDTEDDHVSVTEREPMLYERSEMQLQVTSLEQ